jgi:hypothetical protein
VIGGAAGKLVVRSAAVATYLFDFFVEVVDQEAGAGSSSTGCAGLKLGYGTGSKASRTHQAGLNRGRWPAWYTSQTLTNTFLQFLLFDVAPDHYLLKHVLRPAAAAAE